MKRTNRSIGLPLESCLERAMDSGFLVIVPSITQDGTTKWKVVLTDKSRSKAEADRGMKWGVC